MRQPARAILKSAIALATIIGVGASTAVAQDAPQPSVASAEEFLELLEHADDGLETLSAKIQYAKTKKLEGDLQIRRGKLFFDNTPSDETSGRAFVIEFRQRMINKRLEDDAQRWVFDGQWLVEERRGEKTFIKRRIAMPGETFDPLRIGEGPMPIPIGQKADDILARYVASLLDAGDGLDSRPDLVKATSGMTQLMLLPHERFREDEDLQEIRLWYEWRQPRDGESREARFMPRFARTINRAGDESFVQLIAIRVNDEIQPEIFSTDPPSEADGWDVQIIDKVANAE